MNHPTDSELNQLLYAEIPTVKQAIDYFQKHEGDFLPEHQEQLESIIQANPNDEAILEIVNEEYLRPAVLVQDCSFEKVKDNPWEHFLEENRKQIEVAIKSTGIFEIQSRRTKVPSGTGWVLSDDLIVTNQHVATQFFEEVDGRYQFKKGFERLTIDFKEEFDRVLDREFQITGLVHIEEGERNLHPQRPDLAILRAEKINKNGEKLPPALPLFGGRLKKNQLVFIVGFPGADYKLPDTRKRIFRNIYDVKRIQPGLIRSFGCQYEYDFKHDCATLSGNSGSPVIDLKTGAVVGIHFGGVVNEFEGCAVQVNALRKILKLMG